MCLHLPLGLITRTRSAADERLTHVELSGARAAPRERALTSINSAALAAGSSDTETDR